MKNGVRKVRPVVLVCVGLLVCSLFSGVVVGRDDPLEVLWVTDIKNMDFEARYLRNEPMIDAIIIPGYRGGGAALSTLEVRRLLRRYYPRSYQELVERYEFAAFKKIEFSFFTPAQLEWVRQGIEDSGLGGLVEDAVMTHSTAQLADSTFSEAFPTDAGAVAESGIPYRRGSMEIILNEDPTLPRVFTRLKDHLSLEFSWMGTALIIPRKGSRIYAWAKTDIPRLYPWVREQGTWPSVVGWQYGKGYTWCEGMTSSLGIWRGEYGPDAYFSMLMHSTGRGLPEDVVFVHKLKKRFSEYSEKQWLIISMMEFVEKFGANTNPLMVKIIGMDNTWSEARRLYVAQDYEGSWSLFDQLLASIDSFSEEAMALKDKTLFWVYVSEWCVVTAVSLLSGFTLWTLMVGRRLYKIVDQTRLRPPPGETSAEWDGCSKDSQNAPWWGTGRLNRLLAVN